MIQYLKSIFFYNPNYSLEDKFKYWRIRIFYSIYLGYVFYYLSRGSFRILGTTFTQDGFLSKEELGLILSSFSIFYAISKFTSGMLADIFNPRYVMSIGLFITGLINLFLANSYNFSTILMLWSLNGFFQGFGWPPVSKLLTRWYSKKERGSWWGMWSTSHNLGDALIPQIITIALKLNNFKLGFYIPGIIAVIFSIVLFERVREHPKSVNLPDVREYMNDNSDSKSFNKKENIPFLSLLVKYVFTNGYVWSLILASFFIYLIRFSLHPWITYFFENKGYGIASSIAFLTPLEIGGFLGSLLAGRISDKVFKGKRSYTNILFCLGLLVTVLIFWKLPYSNPFYDSAIISLIGFFIYGPQMLVGIAIAEASHKEAVSTSTGFAGMWSYFAAILPNLYCPKIGWNIYFIILIIYSIAAIVFFSPLIRFEYKKNRKK